MNKRMANVQSQVIARKTANDRIIKWTVLLAITGLLVFSLVLQAIAQQQPQPAVQATKKEYLGPASDTIKPYVPANKDPFKKVIKPKPKEGPGGKPKEPKPVGFPSLEERRAKFKMLVDEYVDKGMAEPNPVMQYLVSELEIIGVFRDDLGFGAFARATPTGSTFFIRRGSRCYNGEILRIESDTSDSGARVTFKQETYQINPDGKQIKLENIVAKQPSATSGPKVN
ncbi:MAG: hypothetical protein AB1757_05040 [Acidobacteriota bacterium]